MTRWLSKEDQAATFLHAYLHLVQESEGGATYFLAEDASGFTGAAIMTDPTAQPLEPPEGLSEAMEAAANLDRVILFKDATFKEMRSCIEVGFFWGGGGGERLYCSRAATSTSLEQFARTGLRRGRRARPYRLPPRPRWQANSVQDPLELKFIAASKPGSGVGSLLMQRIVEFGRQQGRSIWLEASTPASSRLYARHGFRVWKEIVAGEGAPALIGMLWTAEHP